MGDTLDRMLSEEFRFQRFVVDGIDNEPVLSVSQPHMRKEEICLVSNKFNDASNYLNVLHDFVSSAINKKRAAPVVRFADGEYAFYAGQLTCNGLYRQAESVKAIHKAIPFHLDALKALLVDGKAAPLIFPGNTQIPYKGFFPFLKKSKRDSSARLFLDFLEANGLYLSEHSYIPFFSVYAYLTSKLFYRLIDGKIICVINSDNREEDCRQWFTEHNCKPELYFVSIPEEFMATQWPTIRAKVLDAIPRQTDLCLVGAGIGALPLCVDAALHLGIPAIDGGHVINMINGLVSKSNGPRLYTLWREGGKSRSAE